jgi:hypothetical protein
VQGGGFCGARQKLRSPLDLAAYDGVALRVKGDGSIFKLNIKTTDQLDMPESTYQVCAAWASTVAMTVTGHSQQPVLRMCGSLASGCCCFT